MYSPDQIKKGIKKPTLIWGEAQRQVNRSKRLYFRARAEFPHSIGIKGNYRIGNIGDRAVGEILQKQLSDENRNVKLFDRHIETSRAPVRILGGGGVIYDRFGVSDLRSRVNYVLDANKGGIIGVGVPGLASDDSKEYLKETLPRIDLITVRSERDAKILEEICDIQVHTTACPSLLYENPAAQNKYKTGINFRPWFYYDSEHLNEYFDYSSDIDTNKANREYIKNAKEVIRNVEDPVFIPFEKKDEQFAREYFDIDILPYEFSVQKTLKRVSSVEKMVATRYHSLIFAAVCNKPVLAISYAPKVSQMAKRMNIHYQEPHSKDMKIRFDNVENMKKLRREGYKNIELMNSELL